MMLEIDNKLIELSKEVEEEIKEQIEKIDQDCMYNSRKVLEAFHNHKVADVHFGTTTGYGYGDIGRDCIEEVFAEVLGAEDSLVRSQFISGTHALTVALFAFLRPGDTLLSITGKPYDTLDEIIGIVENKSSLKSYKVNYEQIDLIQNDFDYEKIQERVEQGNIKVIEIQRSKGYSTRESLTMDKLEKVIKMIKSINQDIIIMVDNCYCEFVERKTPLEVGADVIVGSLIKNLGGGIAPNRSIYCRKKRFSRISSRKINLSRTRKRSRTYAWN